MVVAAEHITKPPSRKPPPSSKMGCGGARLQIRGCPHLTDAIVPSLPATRMSRQHRHKYSIQPVLDVGQLPPRPCHPGPRIAALPAHWPHSVPSQTAITCIVTGSPRSPRYLILATTAYWCTCRLGWRAMHVSNSARNLVLLAHTSAGHGPSTLPAVFQISAPESSPARRWSQTF